METVARYVIWPDSAKTWCIVRLSDQRKVDRHIPTYLEAHIRLTYYWRKDGNRRLMKNAIIAG